MTDTYVPHQQQREDKQAKVFFEGTHRVRTPEQTWAMLTPLFARYGVTRIADVTGLDTLGISVAMAVRPLARLLVVSQGKGQTPLLASISGAMECIELWHAENNHPPLVHAATSARDLDLPYRISQLGPEPGALATDATPMDWVSTVGMISGATVPVPAAVVTLPPDRLPWSPLGLRWTSNGLASGNSYEEACLHALYEVIERDALTLRASAGPVDHIDPSSITDPVCAPLIAKIQAAGVTLTVTRLTSRFDVPCFGATVWGPDFPLVCIGWGAHLDAGVALSRAVTEAVQTRLTAIAGSRDDLPSAYLQVRLNTEEPAPPEGPVTRWEELDAVGPGSFTDLAEELVWVCGRVAQVTGVEPLCCDLSTVAEFAVVKVVAPGMVFDFDLLHTSH
ncbi:MAG TPA: YcaO-like family protein [Pseudonocardiaceae bacterium]|jgi:ribosomal protein S12 methylthiotransferase accessory factor|nr:YcaO-like family protein [Pseudonocardiaceae bacterium]